MTTPKQTIFNPAQFKAPATQDDSAGDNSGSHTLASGQDKKEYPITGNATRDQVRKLLFESFQGDKPVPNEALSVGQVVDNIENDIFDECKDPKSKQYRDKSRAVQIKLKGARFEQSRSELRSALITSKDFIRDDYVQGSGSGQIQNAQVPQAQNPIRPNVPVVRPQMAGPRPAMGIRPMVPGGAPMMRPRFPAGAPPMFRPLPVTMVQLPPQPIEEQNVQQNDEIKIEESKIEERPQVQEIESQNQPAIEQAPQSVMMKQASFSSQIAESSPQEQVSVQQQQIQEQSSQLADHQLAANPPLQSHYVLDSSLNVSQLHNQSMDQPQFGIDEDQSAGSLQHPSKKKVKKKKKKVSKRPDGGVDDDDDLAVHHHPDSQPAGEEDLQQPQPQVLMDMNRSFQQEQPAEEAGFRKQVSQLSSQNEEHLRIAQEAEGGIQAMREKQQVQEEIKEVEERPIEEPPIEVNTRSANLEERKFYHEPENNQDQGLNQVTSLDQQPSKRQNLLNDLEDDEPSSSNQDQFNNADHIFGNKSSLIRGQRAPSQDMGSGLNIPSRVHHLNENQMNNEQVKGLKDSLQYKKSQQKELSERLVHLENDCQLQHRKAALLMEENKNLQSELRQKDRELQNLKAQQDLSEQQLQLNIKSLERQLREKQTEIENLKKELQKKREKDDCAQNQQNLQTRERQSQLQHENESQLNYLQTLLRSLETRVNAGSAALPPSHILGAAGSGSFQSSSGIVGNASNNNHGSSSNLMGEGAGASNYQQQEQMMESVQKEMREMKQLYEGRLRELNEELQSRMRNLQRVERQNLQLQERNNRLSNIVQSMEVQQLSTVAGSGSNQRDNFVGSRVRVDEDEDGRVRQSSSMAHNPAQRQHMIYQGEDEGTGGLNNQQMLARNQEFALGDDGGSAQHISSAAVMISGNGGAIGIGGGVGTTSSAQVFNDGFDDDEGYQHHESGSNNQIRGERGAAMHQRQPNQMIDAVGSGGGQPDDEPDDEDHELEEEDQEDDGEDHEDEDYDPVEEEEGDGDSDVNGGVAGAGGLDDDQDADDAGMEEDEEGAENGDEDENDEEGTQNQHEGVGAVGSDIGYVSKSSGGMVTGGAARGLRSGHQQHNIQGYQEIQRGRDGMSGHGQFAINHQNQQYQHLEEGDMLAASGASQGSTAVVGGRINSRGSAVSGGGQRQRAQPLSNNVEERKQGQKARRGNRQQNQQHTNASGNATGSGGSSNMQNSRVSSIRNSRGRQQRSNQQHVQSAPSQQQHQQQELGATPPSQAAQPSTQRVNLPPQEYFQSYGDSSSHYPVGTGIGNNNNRDQSASQAPNYSVMRDGAAGGGVVHTVGRATQPSIASTTAVSGGGAGDSMMSAESGSTALLDRNLYQRNNNNPMVSQISSGRQLQASSIQHIQTGSNVNNQLFGTGQSSSAEHLFQESNIEPYAAAVGAPPQSRAAAPRQRQQHQNNQQNSSVIPHNNYYQEESKHSDNVQSLQTFYSNNNQQPLGHVRTHQIPSGGVPAHSSHGQHPHQFPSGLQNQYPNGVQTHYASMMGGSSGEQEEESSSGLFSGPGVGGPGSGMMTNFAQYGGGAGSSGYERGRNQQQQQTSSRLGLHLDQSHATPTRNDSRKTSGASTPNKDGADTPTTKAYRNSQNPYVQVHNLTSSHLFFNSGSNQDEAGDAPFYQSAGPHNNNLMQFGVGLGSGTHPQNSMSASARSGAGSHQQHHAGGMSNNAAPSGNATSQNPSSGVEADVINPNLFE